MKKRGARQLLPTPQTSTTSTTSWVKEDFEGSSEIDVILVEEHDSFDFKVNNSIRRVHSSWPFRSNSGKSDFNFVESLTDNLTIQLKRASSRDFPYFRAMNRLNDREKGLLFDRKLWKFLLTVSTVYSGTDLQGDRQKRNEIAFAAWTTLLRVYSLTRVRGLQQLDRLAVASVTLQAKLLEEADVDLVKLERKISKSTETKISKDLLKATERRISSLLDWKLLTPSPQVFLFLCLDVLSASGLDLPTTLKLLVSKVLDVLIEDYFIHDYLRDVEHEEQAETGIASLVVSVIETVLGDFFSAFPETATESLKNIQLHLPIKPVNLPTRFKERIEKSIEKIINEA